MERIVYFLGAGFSHPLKLPIMSNFIEKSRDMYFSDRENNKSMGEVLEKVREMAFAGAYYDIDLHNIEEVLSILEMQSHVGVSSMKEKYVE